MRRKTTARKASSPRTLSAKASLTTKRKSLKRRKTTNRKAASAKALSPKATPTTNPDDGVQIGKSYVATEHLNELKKAWKNRRLVLFLGAGVSSAYGLANWTDLVLDLLLNEESKFEKFWPHYRKALALWMTDYFDFSPLAVARIVKHSTSKAAKQPLTENQKRKRFLEAVRQSLYSTFTLVPSAPTTLQTIARVIESSENSNGGRRIPAVFTTNFDNVLELELNKLGIHPRPVFDARRPTEKELRIVHVHGYLPHTGAIPKASLVFTEDDYHQLSYSPFHWALVDIINCLRNNTVLFIGLSMSDPNLRRLLDATTVANGVPAHFLVRKTYDLEKNARQRGIRIVNEYAKEQAERAKLDQIKTKSNVSDALDVMLKQATRYDTRLFNEMGLGTIWVKRFDDIPLLLNQIIT